jgi:hypothetical protein
MTCDDLNLRIREDGLISCDDPERVRRMVEAHDALVEALSATVAYVELFTGNGVRRQPPARYIGADGSYDAEAMSRDARAALTTTTGE